MRPFFCFCLLVGLSASVLAQDYPQAEISNGVIHAELMLPDSQNGSYRGTRFDWSGIISSLQFRGHEYFGRWYEKHDPKIHDAITGPVELTDDPGGAFHEEMYAIHMGGATPPSEPGAKRVIVRIVARQVYLPPA